MEYIPVEKNNIPYTFSVELGAEVFDFTFRYNLTYDFFTVDLAKDGEPLVYGEKIVYGVPLFNDVYDQRFPAPTIVPLDPSDNEERVSFLNFGETVFLVVDNQ